MSLISAYNEALVLSHTGDVPAHRDRHAQTDECEHSTPASAAALKKQEAPLPRTAQRIRRA